MVLFAGKTYTVDSRLVNSGLTEAALSNGTQVSVTDAIAGSRVEVVYDGWNPILESVTDSQQQTAEIVYIWGLDLSKTLRSLTQP